MANIVQLIAAITPELAELRRWLHQHPEPAFKEERTAGKIIDCLSSVEALDIRSGFAGTGVVATLGADKKGPCVALRADMDCLKMQEENDIAHASKNDGFMHACGHDGHVACLVGAAKVLAKLSDELAGPVKFLFQPAEEKLGGAEGMIKDGALKNPEVKAIFALHGTTDLPVGTIGLRSGPAMAASRDFTITVQGKGCHAAAPHRGVDPVLIGSQIVCSAQSIISRNVDPREVCLISIPRFIGSTASNVSPERAILEGTLRALSDGTRTLLEKRLTELVRQTALAYGGSAEVAFYGGYPLLKNDEEAVRLVADAASRVLSEGKISQDFPPSLGAEDFAYFLQQVRGAFFWLGLAEPDHPSATLHHPCFDFNDRAIPLAVRLHCEIVCRYNRC